MGIPPGSASALPCSTAMAADLDEKVRSLLLEAEQEDQVSHTFAQRAEAYYQKRPQLLSLLHHLYTSYLSLSQRHHHLHLHPPSNSSDSFEDVVSDVGSISCLSHLTSLSIDSDADSTVSTYPNPVNLNAKGDRLKMMMDRMVEEVVMGSVQIHLLMDEEAGGKREAELRRKVELQKSLVEVLESERMILLKENARLRYDNEALSWEAGELGRCMMRMRREEHRRAFALGRKIEDLQGQIYGLERRNQEYSEQLLRSREQSGGRTSVNGIHISKSKGRFLATTGGGGVRAAAARLWEQIRRLDFLVCGPGLHRSPTAPGPACS